MHCLFSFYVNIMDNSKREPSLFRHGLNKECTTNTRKNSKRYSSIIISSFSIFILLASVFMVNISTINTAEAKSESSETKAKHKKSTKGKRYKRSKKKKYYKKRYKKRKYSKRSKRSKRAKYKKRRYSKRSKRAKYKKRKYSKRSKRAKYKKRRYSKRSKRAKYKKARYAKKGSKRYKKKRRSRYITCDQLKPAVLRRKARKYQKTISHAARTYGVSQNMIKAVITVETCFRSGLKGTSGEKGLMQLMPATAKRFGVKNRFSTWQNIHGGTRYLSYLLRQYKGNKHYAAAAYNGGMGAVSKRTGPKFKAVRVYSAKVMNAYPKFNPLVMVKSKKKKYKKRKKKL